MKSRFKFAKLLYISLLELDKINKYTETKIHEVKKYANRMDKKRTKDIFAKLGCSHGLIVIKPWLINWYSMLNALFLPNLSRIFQK